MFYKTLVCISLLILTVEICLCNFSLTFSTFSYGDFSVSKAVENSISFYDIPKTKFTSVEKTKNSLLLVGDVMLARNVEYLMDKKGSDYPFLGISFNDFDKNPLVVGNFESSVPEQHFKTQENQLRFSVNEQYLSELRRSGFSHLSLANNHTFDFGKTSLENTKNELLENNLTPFGNPNKLTKDSVSFINIGDQKVALIGICTLEKEPTDNELFNVFSFAKKNSDFQIVYVHWGLEYESEGSPKQKKLASRFVEAGADLIVGHHPHVVQEVDYIDGVLVFYSLGNYIFDQYFSDSVQNGLLLQIDLNENKSISLIPVTSIGNLSQPTYMTPKNHAAFLSLLAKKSHVNLKGYIQKGLIPLNINVATSSKIAMIEI